MLRLRNLIILIFLFSPVISFCQGGRTPPIRPKNDTLAYTLVQFEKQFLDSNLQFLSQKYNITENKTYIKQVKIWDQRISIVVIGRLLSKTTLTITLLPQIIHFPRYRKSLKNNRLIQV